MADALWIAFVDFGIGKLHDKAAPNVPYRFVGDTFSVTPLETSLVTKATVPGTGKVSSLLTNAGTNLILFSTGLAPNATTDAQRMPLLPGQTLPWEFIGGEDVDAVIVL